MKQFGIILVLVAIGISSGKPVQESKAQIIKYESERSGHGNYRYSYETSNGLIKEETGEVLNENSDREQLSVRGSYSYVAPDGSQHIVYYVADEKGFRPRVEHKTSQVKLLPVPDVEEPPKGSNRTAPIEDTFPEFIGTALLATLGG